MWDDFKETLFEDRIVLILIGILVVYGIYLELNFKIGDKEGHIIAIALIGFWAGTASFLSGFKRSKASRIIEDIPTSKIGTGAVGSNVAINGLIPHHRDKLLTAPISGKPCTCYFLTVSKEKVASDTLEEIGRISHPEEIYVKEKSGALALVKIKQATVLNKRPPGKFEIGNLGFSKLNDQLHSVLVKGRGDLKGFSLEDIKSPFRKYLLIEETYFAPKEPIYVLGHAAPGGEHKTKNGHPVKMVIERKEPHLFLISNQSDKSVTEQLGDQSDLKIWGGAALAITCLGVAFTLISNLPLK